MQSFRQAAFMIQFDSVTIQTQGGHGGSLVKERIKIRWAIFISRAAMIAAIYATLTISLSPISYGPLQFRVSEALTTLPWLYPEAAPGLFIGCLIANLFGGQGVWDVVFGSLATLAAALATSRVRSPWLAPLPPVLINAAVVGAVLSLVLGLPFWTVAAQVGLGQAGACYGLGLPLLFALTKAGGSLSR